MFLGANSPRPHGTDLEAEHVSRLVSVMVFAVVIYVIDILLVAREDRHAPKPLDALG